LFLEHIFVGLVQKVLFLLRNNMGHLCQVLWWNRLCGRVIPECSCRRISLPAGTGTATLPLPVLVLSLIPDENTQPLWVKTSHSAQRFWPKTERKTDLI